MSKKKKESAADLKESKRIEWRLEKWPLSKLKPYEKNPRIIADDGLEQLGQSFDEIGNAQPININTDGTILSGHARRLRICIENGWQFKEVKSDDGKVTSRELVKKGDDVDVAVYVPDRKLTPKQEEAVIVRMNKNTAGIWDMDKLLAGFDIDDLLNWDFSPEELTAPEVDANSSDSNSDASKSLAERFLIPPFSVFNAREGWWQKRKRAWLSYGIKSEEGRDAPSYKAQSDLNNIMKQGKKGLTHTGAAASFDYYRVKNGEREATDISGTSIFDPVLCEIAYRWFCPDNGLVVDPFAGGSVRGIVAAKLGRHYMGGELRKEQVDANKKQAEQICSNDGVKPSWFCADSRFIDKTMKGAEADFVFSCPPYADLERYSDDPKDLSTLSYENFKKAYFEIIKKTCSLLKQDRFACFVVGEVRDKKGNYYDFVGDTVEAFMAAGLQYYNEAILVTSVGSLPIRAGRQFAAGRKLGKTHQNVLVFVKGDAKKATKACGDVDVSFELIDQSDELAQVSNS